MKLIFSTNNLNFFNRIKQSKFKIYLYILILASFLTIIVCWNEFEILNLFGLISISFMTILLIRIPAYKNYLLNIEIDKNTLVFQYSSGLMVPKCFTFETEINNFKIKYYRNPKYFPLFQIEQKSPYKKLYTQYCFGVWSNKKSFEIIRQYANLIEYNE